MKSTSPTRNGFLYLAVLFTSLIVMATTIAAFSISTNRLRGEASQIDASSALRAAEAESHRIASLLSTADLSWRTTSTSGLISSWRAGDDGAMLCSQLVDVDANLSDDPADLVEVSCYASIGRARRGVAYKLQPVAKPLPILDFCIVSSGGVNVTAGGSLACTGKVRSGASVVVAAGAVASASQWHATTTIQSTARGEKITSGATIAIPASTITSSYIAIGTEIPLSSLLLASGVRRLQKTILTATSNPFGAADSDGVYWINGSGLPVTVSECRIEATLVIINSSQVTIADANVWKAPVEGGAALVTTAPIAMDQCVVVLRESTTSVNYNPASIPFRGVADNDMADRYQSCIEGLVYTPTIFEWRANNARNGMLLKGTIVCGNAIIGGLMSIEDDRRSQSNPPLGFRVYDSMRFVRGSWRSVQVPAI